MRLARVLGWVLMALAATAAGAEGLAALEAGDGRWLAAGELWYRLAPDGLNLMQAAIQRHVWPALWDPGLVAVLRLPASLVLAVPGTVLLAATRGPRAPRRRFGR